MSGPEYRVNKSTGQVIKDDGTGWKNVASVRNKTTGEILIDEGSGWQPLPGMPAKSGVETGPTPTMRAAQSRIDMAQRTGNPLFGGGILDQVEAMGRPTGTGPTEQEFADWSAKKAAEEEARRIPDNDLKERSLALMNSVTFGNAPRLAAGASTLGALAATPFVEGDIIDREGVSGAMTQFLDEARVHQRRGREERPIESLGLEVVPGLVQGKTIVDSLGKKLLPKTNTVSNVARVAGVGGGYGAIYGASQNESGTVEGALGDAAFGGALGVGGGLALKAAQPAATSGYRAVKTGAASLSDALSAALGKAGTARDRVAEDVAIAAVRRSMERSGMTFDEIMEQVKRYEGKPAVLAEVIGQDAVNALTALTRRPGATPQKAQAIIEERAFARPERMRADLEDATGIRVGQLDETLDTQLAERRAAAKPLYDQLYKRFSKTTSFGESLKRVNRLKRTPTMQRHLELADKAMRTAAAVRGIPISKMSTMEYWDLVKQSLDDAIASAVGKGEARTRVGESVQELTALKSELVGELDRLTGGAYAAAREAGGEAPRLRAAATAGQKAMQARNPREVAKTVAATLAQDLPALRAGVVDDLGTKIDRGMVPNRVRVPDVAGKLRAALGEDSANKLINRFDAEAALSETGSRWAPRLNSVTGTVMESGATAMGDDLINAGFNLATGNKVGLLRQAINFMRQRGFSQRQIDAIGDLLLSSPEEGLKRLRVMAPDGVPTGVAAPIAGGGGGGLPPGGGGSPVPAPSAPKPTPGKPKRNIGTKVADASAIAALSLAPPAQAQGGGSAELDAANERVNMATQRVADVDKTISRLEADMLLLEDPNADPRKVQDLLDRRGFDLGPRGIDGNIGPDTRKAIAANIAAIKGELATERAQREAGVAEVAAARDAAKQIRMQKIQADAEPGKGTELAREFGPYGGAAAGIAAAYLMRRGAAGKAKIAAQAAAKRADDLLTAAPINARAGMNHSNGINKRASNLNDFWRLGGAGEGTPFEELQKGSWKPRAKGKVMNPSNLYPEPGFLSSRLRTSDYGWAATGLVESQVAAGFRQNEEKKIAKAEADIERFAAAGDEAGLQRATATLQQAKNMHAIALAFERAGYAYAGTRVLAGLKDPYPFVRPNIRAAEEEASSLRAAISKK